MSGTCAVRSRWRCRIIISEVIRVAAFSLGLCLLEAGILESVQGVYDLEKAKFVTAELERLLAKFVRKYNGNTAILNLVQGLLRLDVAARRDFVQLKTELPDWFEMYAPKIGKLGTMSSISSQTRRQNGQPLIIDGMSSPKLTDGRESTKEEIFEFFTANPERESARNIQKVISNNSFNKTELFPVEEDTRKTGPSLNRQVIRDSRTDEREDVFEANGIERFYEAETGDLYMARTSVRIETDAKGKQILRTYVKYDKVTEEKDAIAARRYMEGKKKEHSPVFDLSDSKVSITERDTSKISLNYSVSQSDNRKGGSFDGSLLI